MKNAIKTLTITGGLAASLLFGADSTSAEGNDSLLNGNNGLVENLNILESSDETNLGINLQNDATTDVKSELSDESFDSTVDGHAEGSLDLVVEGDRSSSAVDTEAQTGVMNETRVEAKTISSTTDVAAEGKIGAGVDSEDSSSINADSHAGVIIETVVDEDTVSSTTVGSASANLNLVFEDSTSFWGADSNTSFVNVIESKEANDFSSFALGMDSVTNLSLSSEGTEIEESAKIMAAVSALIEAQSTEESARLGTGLDGTSIIGLDSEGENSVSSKLSATAGIWVQSPHKNDSFSTELGLGLDSHFETMSEMK